MINVYLSSHLNIGNYNKEEHLFGISDKCYWYLYPFLEKIGDSHGLMIDLYGDAAFSSVNLDVLKKQILEACESVDDELSEIEVIDGENNYGYLKKDKMISLLKEILFFIEKAKKEKMYLVFVGD